VVRCVQQRRHRFTELCSIAGGHRALSYTRVRFNSSWRNDGDSEPSELEMKDSRRTHEHNDLTSHGQQQQVESSSVDRAQVQWLHFDVAMPAAECSPVALATS